MALRNTAWHQVEPGQIVSFLYKGQDSNRAVKRTILVLNPNLRYRKKSTKRVKSFVVGLQLDTAITPVINIFILFQLRLNFLTIHSNVKYNV